MDTVEVVLKIGKKCKGDKFLLEDKAKLQDAYIKTIELNDIRTSRTNFNDALTEGLYSLYFNAIRTNANGSGSVDALDSSGEEVQIKSTTVEKDYTSFGPTSTWDKLIFEDFFYTGKLDGTIAFYDIPTESIYQVIVNKKKEETFQDQQKQWRRPRLSIKEEIIKREKLNPIKVVNIFDM